MEQTVVIAGGGWGGCAAACSARRAGARAVLLERTDMLLGTGLVGGIMQNNGRLAAALEMEALGAGELFALTDRCARHRNVSFPGHAHATLYDVGLVPGEVLRHLRSLGVEVVFQARVSGVEREGDCLQAVLCSDGRRFPANAFVDATGTAGPMANCQRYGNGCAMCVLRCPSFGGRISLTGLCGVAEWVGEKAGGGPGAMSGSCKLHKGSLSRALQEKLERDGVAVIPLPPPLREDHLAQKACQQYAQASYRDNLVLLDTGHAKLMTLTFPLEKLRQVPGFENARYEDPYAGGKGNSLRFFAMAPRDDALRVEGVENLYCAGEKAGLLVGHTEAIVTGTLAGHNAARQLAGRPPLVLPRALAVGEAIAYVREQMATGEGRRKKYTFSGSVLWERLGQLGLGSVNGGEIAERVARTGLTGVFAE